MYYIHMLRYLLLEKECEIESLVEFTFQSFGLVELLRLAGSRGDISD